MFANHVKLRTVLGHLDRKLLEDADRVVVSPGVALENYGLSALLQSVRREEVNFFFFCYVIFFVRYRFVVHRISGATLLFSENCNPLFCCILLFHL